MKKKICIFVLLLNTFLTAFASNNDKQIVYAMLMNQIQFSLQTIKHYENRYVLNQEYVNVLNKIDSNKLKIDKNDSNQTIEAYDTWLKSLREVLLRENEKLFIKQQAEKEKSEAIYTTLTNAGTATGIAAMAIAQKDYVGAIAALYASMSTVFSYKSSINNIENQAIKELFKIDQSTLETIMTQETNLFTTYNKLISEHNIPKQYQIKPDQMQWLVETLDSKDAESKVTLLEVKKDLFSYFTPYWFELGSAYQEIGNNKKAKECYNEFEHQKSKYSIIDNDTYYTELAKNRIKIAMEENDIPTIRYYLTEIEKDRTAENESENRFYMAGIYYTIGDTEKALNLLKLIIDDNRQYVSSARTLYEYIDAGIAKDENYKKALLFSQLKIATEEELVKVIDNNKVKSNIASNLIKHFKGKEEEKILNKKNLVFYLPKEIGDSNSINLRINNCYYDSLTFEYQDRIYYFFDYKTEDFFSKVENFAIIIDCLNGNQFVINFKSSFYNSSDVKNIKKILALLQENTNEKNIIYEITSLSYIDVDYLLTTYKNIKNSNDFEEADKKTRIDTISKIYNAAEMKYLSSPYTYCTYCLENSKHDSFFKYGFYSIADRTKKYEISKYGTLLEPKKITSTLSTSLLEIYEKAILGDSGAQYSLGMAYLNGEGIAIDYFEALKLFKSSAINGNMNAYYQLGICFENGYGTEKNKDRAMFYYEQAAALGHQKAEAKLK